MKRYLVPLLFLAVLLAGPPAFAQDAGGGTKLAPPLPPTPVRAFDFENDQGTKIQLGWMTSLDDPQPQLPSVPIAEDAAPGALSLREELEIEIDREKYVWWEYLRRPVKEMLEEKDPLLKETFEGYLAGIVVRHLDAPLLLMEAVPDSSAWLAGFAAALVPDAAKRAPLSALAERLGAPEELKADIQSGADSYAQLRARLKPLVSESVSPARLAVILRTNPGALALMQTLAGGSNLKEDRVSFRTIYTALRDRQRARELREQAVRDLEAADPRFAKLLTVSREPVKEYLLERADSPDGPWKEIGNKGPGATEFEDGGDGRGRELVTGKTYFYRITAVGVVSGARGASSAPVPATPRTQWWYHGRTNNFFATGIFIALIIGWIWGADRKMPPAGILGFFAFGAILGVFAWVDVGTPLNVATLFCWVPAAVAIGVAEIGRRGGELYVRPIAGIQAVEEAIGRATEMGKPILFVPGLSTIEDIATLAALNILGPVAEKAAEYDSKIIVPNRDPIVYTIAQEIVKESYLRAGRPDSYDAGSIYFVTGRQFAYAAAVNGLMLREKPATNFFLGMFWAESLLLAETGAMTGAIQIAGTDAVTQLPFFIVACDYTLIGEELYAAGAYMGRDPKLLGGLKGQDYNKAIVIAALLFFAVVFFGLDLFGARSGITDFIRDAFEVLFKVKN